MRRLLAVVAVATLIVAACDSGAGIDGGSVVAGSAPNVADDVVSAAPGLPSTVLAEADFVGDVWALESMESGGTVVTFVDPDRHPPSITLGWGGIVHVSDGCNSGGDVTYRIDEGRLEIQAGPGFWTLAGCFGTVYEELTDEFHAAIVAVELGEVEGDVMELAGTNVVLVFRRAERFDYPLSGTHWVGTFRDGEPGLREPRDLMQFVFDVEAGTLEVRAQCVVTNLRLESGPDGFAATAGPSKETCQNRPDQPTREQVGDHADVVATITSGFEVELAADRLRIAGTDGRLIFARRARRADYGPKDAAGLVPSDLILSAAFNDDAGNLYRVEVLASGTWISTDPAHPLEIITDSVPAQPAAELIAELGAVDLKALDRAWRDIERCLGGVGETAVWLDFHLGNRSASFCGPPDGAPEHPLLATGFAIIDRIRATLGS